MHTSDDSVKVEARLQRRHRMALVISCRELAPPIEQLISKVTRRTNRQLCTLLQNQAAQQYVGEMSPTLRAAPLHYLCIVQLCIQPNTCACTKPLALIDIYKKSIQNMYSRHTPPFPILHRLYGVPCPATPAPPTCLCSNTHGGVPSDTDAQTGPNEWNAVNPWKHPALNLPPTIVLR